LVMFGWVVWDLIPVYAVHAYQCNANAGFTVYKTLDEWQQENPGIAETLSPDKLPEQYLVETKRKDKVYRYPNGDELTAHFSDFEHKVFSTARFQPRGNTARIWLNQRFIRESTREKYWHIVSRTDERIVDRKTGDILAQYIDFGASTSLYNANKLSDYKLWFDARTCEVGPWPKNRIKFNGFTTSIDNLGS